MRVYFGFGRLGPAVLCSVAASAAFVSVAVAQTVVPKTAAATQPPAQQAMTATEQAAVAQILNQVNSLSGNALQGEVRRLAKQYSDQDLNLTAIAKAVKTASGNKLGAINIALANACKEAPTGSKESAFVCAAAAAQPDNGPGNPVEVAALPGVAAIQTAAIGGGGGAAAGGGLGGGGNATGSGNSINLTSGTNGMQNYSFFSHSSRTPSGVGTSVSTR